MKVIWMMLLALAVAAAGPLGCKNEPDPDDDDDDDSATGDDDTEGPQACPVTGLEPREFIDAPEDGSLGAIAADFTVPTRDGDWNFRDHWTGCDSYLFITHETQATQGYPTPLWERDVDELYERLPRNVHLFFVVRPNLSTNVDPELEEMEERVADVLGEMDDDDREYWEERTHFVTETGKQLEGWLGEANYDVSWGIGINVLQEIRYIGSYADNSRPYDQWFEPNLSMAANEPVYYNYEAIREDRLAAQGAEVVTIMEERLFSPTLQSAEVTLPDAATMAGFDTLEFDLLMGCNGEGEYGDCPAWDGVFFLLLCDEGDDECDRSTGTEIGRWITTYHRVGRYVHDVSGLLPLLAEGGTRTFSCQAHDDYVVDLSLRFSNQGKEVAPAETTFLFTGHQFNETYNDNYEPMSVAIPADAAKVEIAIFITGHGMASPGNCAEFCNVEHTFTVNGTPNLVDYPNAGTSRGCMEMVDSGTIPNQYGTWWYGRNGWCPGRQTDVVLVDITDQVTPGEEAVFEYEGWFDAGFGYAPYTGSGANIEMKTWLVVSS